jgi:hypothetical protein
MVDNTNFCDGRLRLTAFLRVVENGMPPRPSRFKRRVPLEETSPQDSAFSEAVYTEESPEDLPNSTSSRTSGPNTDATSEVPSAQKTDLEVTCSLTPMRLRVYPDSYRHLGAGSSNEESDCEQPTAIHAISQASTYELAVPVSKVKTKSSRPSKATDTRKRRLPTTGLALVRTTTSDGLPDPSVRELLGYRAMAVPQTDKKLRMYATLSLFRLQTLTLLTTAN